MEGNNSFALHTYYRSYWWHGEASIKGIGSWLDPELVIRQPRHGYPCKSFNYANCGLTQLPMGSLSTNLTHWGRVTHICVGKLTIIDSDNGLSPGRRQAIIWTNAGILLIAPWGTNFSEILIGVQTFSFKKMHLKMSSAKWRPFCLDLNVLSNNRHSPKSTFCPLCRDIDKTVQLLMRRRSAIKRGVVRGEEFWCRFNKRSVQSRGKTTLVSTLNFKSKKKLCWSKYTISFGFNFVEC